MILPKDIIKEWDLGSMTKEKQRLAAERISRILYQAILVRSLDILSEEEQAELDELLDTDSTMPEDTMSFLKKKIPTFDRLFAEEVQNLKDNLFIHA